MPIPSWTIDLTAGFTANFFLPALRDLGLPGVVATSEKSMARRVFFLALSSDVLVDAPRFLGGVESVDLVDGVDTFEVLAVVAGEVGL